MNKLVFVYKLEFEFKAENLDAAKEIVSQMIISYPEPVIATLENLGASEESLTEYHEQAV